MNWDLKKIAKALEQQGFDTEVTTRGHLRVFLNGILVTTVAVRVTAGPTGGAPQAGAAVLITLVGRRASGAGSTGRPRPVE